MFLEWRLLQPAIPHILTLPIVQLQNPRLLYLQDVI